MRYFLIIIVQLFIQYSFSQSIEEEIRAQFESSGQITWFKYFKGRIDDFNDIVVVLAHDGSNCRGQLKYLRSKTTFQLIGKIKNQVFELKEIDNKLNTSGFLKGRIEGNVIHAEWTNFDNSIASKIWLEETKTLQDFPVHCGDNKWISLYMGKGSGIELELILHKEAGDHLSGIAYLQGKSYDIRGDIDNRNFLNIYLKKYVEQNFARLEGDFKNQNFFRANLIEDDGASRSLTFKLKERLRVGCVEYADYVTSFDITYPKTRSAAFNNWIRHTINGWTQSCRNYSKKVSDSSKPELRASERAYGWCQLDMYSSDLISGFLSFSSTWENGKLGLAFNFDAKNELLITKADIFKSHFDQNQFLKPVIKILFKNHPLYNDEGFRKWIEHEAAFPFFTIRKEGINFSTDFNILYGRQNVTIPFEELRPFLRHNPLLKIN